ncbi:MAG: hypothetical protein M1825_002047 [Sarcosagium campestre]|nr:MAG: hypothetical protein M1825_002047 [Sarcosagium campestre]
MIVDDFIDEDSAPCPLCGTGGDEEVLLLCDGCDVAFHTYCLGLESVPSGHWYCEECDAQRALDPYRVCLAGNEIGPGQGRQSHHPPNSRTRGQERRVRSSDQVNARRWARVWQSVWDQLNLDLDFPFDEDDAMAQYHTSQRNQEQREFRQWERRFEVAQRQGGNASRFRETRPVLLETRARQDLETGSPAESQSELRAWNALEKAKEIDVAKSNKRKRKSRSVTASPSEPGPSLEPERKLKRPRTRRTQDVVGPSSDSAAASPAPRTAPARRTSAPRASSAETNNATPSFLQSLIKEVESSSTLEDGQVRFRPAALSAYTPPADQASPRALSSPGSSPTTSNHPSPRAHSATPPPHSGTRPGSPLMSLTSKVEPVFPAPDFSPSHPSSIRNAPPSTAVKNGRARSQERQSLILKQLSPTSSIVTADETSPSRATMSLAAKADVEKMVRSALKPLYQKHNLSKDEYTNVNRTVSRMLYDRVGDISTLDLQSRQGWERTASEHVQRAIEELRAAS